MAPIRFRDWQLEVNLAETRRAQAARESGDPERCACLHCKNFVAARGAAYPLEFSELLNQLGIPANHESEVYHYAEVAPGLHSYGGVFHFVGSILAGPDAHAGSPNGGAIELEDISDRFAMGFTATTALVPSSFPASGVTEVVFTAEVPWVLNEPFAG